MNSRKLSSLAVKHDLLYDKEIYISGIIPQSRRDEMCITVSEAKRNLRTHDIPAQQKPCKGEIILLRRLIISPHAGLREVCGDVDPAVALRSAAG
jgi:hypothetical protein